MNRLLTTLVVAWWGFVLALYGLKVEILHGFIIMGCITITFVALYLADYYSRRTKQLPLFPVFTLKRYRIFYAIITGLQVFEGGMAIYVGAIYFQLITLFPLPKDLTYTTAFFVCLIVVGILFIASAVYRLIKWKKPSKIT